MFMNHNFLVIKVSMGLQEVCVYARALITSVTWMQPLFETAGKLRGHAFHDPDNKFHVHFAVHSLDLVFAKNVLDESGAACCSWVFPCKRR